MKKIVLLLIVASGLVLNAMAQDSLQVPAEKSTATVVKPKFTKATFKSSRIINMQSVEIVSKGTLQFMISHHFGYIWNKDLGEPRLFNKNLAQLFGFNSGIAHTYLSLDYSPLNWLNVGAAATGSSHFDGWVKLKLLRQQTGKRNIPVTVDWFSLSSVDASPRIEGELTWNRFSFLHQLLIARKFSDKFSLQLMPTMIHFNIVPYGINNSNYVYSLGLGGRYKISSKKALTFEYARQLNMYKNLLDKNGNIYQYTPDLLAVGFEFDTGGHLFQFYVGNTISSTNIDQLARNTSKIRDGKFALGFTINRGFSLKK
ncbi:MAG: DUF5777 family beta-barrel protein [Bacteroidota bacterium]|nr:DUF5777 family beta-barrel protein [Bacteroidota bacterium]